MSFLEINLNAVLKYIVNFKENNACDDINECVNSTICPANSQCYNSLGTYSCRCNQDYKEQNSSISSQNPNCILIPTTTTTTTTTTTVSTISTGSTSPTVSTSTTTSKASTTTTTTGFNTNNRNISLSLHEMTIIIYTNNYLIRIELGLI